MSSEPSHVSHAAAADRRQAVWPWLLLPLVALALFFALQLAKNAQLRASLDADVLEPATSSEDAEAP